MILELQVLPDEPFHDVTMNLDGVDYTLSFMYNQRIDQWFLSVRDSAGLPIVLGVAIVCDWPLLRAYNDARLPAGTLMCQSNVDTDKTAPGLGELGPGRRCALYYATRGETFGV